MKLNANAIVEFGLLVCFVAIIAVTLSTMFGKTASNLTGLSKVTVRETSSK